MAENLLTPPKKDNTPMWFKKHGVEPRCFPAHIARELIADKNLGWEECEPEFVAKTKVRPIDDGKTNAAIKNANTDKTARQYEAFTTQTVAELKEFAKANEISLQGISTKKGILEAIEKAGKLLK